MSTYLLIFLGIGVSIDVAALTLFRFAIHRGVLRSITWSFLNGATHGLFLFIGVVGVSAIVLPFRSIFENWPASSALKQHYVLLEYVFPTWDISDLFEGLPRVFLLIVALSLWMLLYYQRLSGARQTLLHPESEEGIAKQLPPFLSWILRLGSIALVVLVALDMWYLAPLIKDQLGIDEREIALGVVPDSAIYAALVVGLTVAVISIVVTLVARFLTTTSRHLQGRAAFVFIEPVLTCYFAGVVATQLLPIPGHDSAVTQLLTGLVIVAVTMFMASRKPGFVLPWGEKYKELRREAKRSFDTDDPLEEKGDHEQDDSSTDTVNPKDVSDHIRIYLVGVMLYQGSVFVGSTSVENGAYISLWSGLVIALLMFLLIVWNFCSAVQSIRSHRSFSTGAVILLVPVYFILVLAGLEVAGTMYSLLSPVE